MVCLDPDPCEETKEGCKGDDLVECHWAGYDECKDKIKVDHHYKVVFFGRIFGHFKAA